MTEHPPVGKDIITTEQTARSIGLHRRCKELTNRKKVVGRNLLRIVGAEGEANIFEGAFKTVDARSLHPQTPFRAFPVQVVVAVHHFF